MGITIDRDLKAIQDLRKEYHVRATDIRGYKDPLLSEEGLAAERSKRLKELRAEGKSLLERIQHSVNIDRDYLKSQAEKAMPEPEGSTADTWVRVQMLLNAGRDLGVIIRQTTDIRTLQAIREWGPTYLESKRAVTFADGLNGTPPADPTPLLNSVGRRWAELTGKEAELADYFNSLGGFAKFDVLAKDTVEIFEGRGHNPMEVQIEAQLAYQHASSDLSEAEPAN
ncbi:hypothetical protein GCM10027417_30580 [Glutamicibacter endophyticus]